MNGARVDIPSLSFLLDMSNLSFNDSYRTILNIGRKVGLPLPWFSDVSPLKTFLHNCYEKIVGVFLVYKYTCTALAVIVSEELDDNIFSMALFFFLTIVTFLNFFYTFKKKGFKRYIENLDLLTLRLQNCGLGQQQYFDNLHRTESKKLTDFVKMMCVSSLICPFFYSMSVPIFGVLDGNYGKKFSLPNRCFFEKDVPKFYEVIMFLQFLNLALPGVMKLSHECIMIALFRIHATYFKYLSVAVRGLGDEMNQKHNIPQEKLLTWIRLHQDIVKSVVDLMDFFSPVIFMYYLSIIGMVAPSFFYQMHAKNANGFQAGFLGAYMVITLFRMYLQCHMAGDVTIEANNVAFEVYSIPWYEMDQKNKMFVKLAITMANRPLHIDAFRVPGFRLNKESYKELVTGTVSAYLAFNKMMGM